MFQNVVNTAFEGAATTAPASSCSTPSRARAREAIKRGVEKKSAEVFWR